MKMILFCLFGILMACGGVVGTTKGHNADFKMKKYRGIASTIEYHPNEIELIGSGVAATFSTYSFWDRRVDGSDRTFSLWDREKSGRLRFFSLKRHWDVAFRGIYEPPIFDVGDNSYIYDLGQGDCDPRLDPPLDDPLSLSGLQEWSNQYYKTKGIPPTQRVTLQEAIMSIDHCYLVHNRHSDQLITSLFHVKDYDPRKIVNFKKQTYTKTVTLDQIYVLARQEL